jgi:hypothetical protein
VLVHALTGAACLQLFRRYPLAVTPQSAESGYRTMVLMNRTAGPAGFFVLTQASDDLFVIRSWNRHNGIHQQIRPGEPVSDIVHEVVTGGMPVPHDGALLGWITDSQVTVMLAAHCKQPETWDDPVPVPEIRVMPMAGTSELLHWPPFAASPLDGGQLWDYVERGQVVDIAPSSPRAPDVRSGCLRRTGEAPGTRKGASLSPATCPPTSTGCRPACTPITGRSARASSRRPPTAC